jgi:hypothetical protein
MEKMMRHHQTKQKYSLKKQAGATMLGVMFVAAALVFVALIAMKVFPAYQEYYSVKTVLVSLNKEPLSSMSKKEIQDSFDRRANTSYVTVVTGTDLTIEKNSAGETVASVEYQVIKPLFGNISILIDFSSAN